MDLNYSHTLNPSFEINHWWMRSRYRLIDQAIEKITRPSFSVLEIGAGTGINLRYLREHYGSRILRMVGTDPAATEKTAAELSVQKEWPIDRFDLILLLDVLEHCPDPISLLRDLRSRLAEGGYLLVTVPAFQALWSHYDELAHHVKRYSFKMLTRELNAGGWHIESQFFLFALLFPLFAAQRIFVRLGLTHPQLFKPVPAVINHVLYFLTRLEMLLFMRGNRWVGSSIIAFASRATHE